MNALAFDEVDHVRPAFFHFVDALDIHAGCFDHIGCARRGHEFEPHVHELAGDRGNVRFVVVGHADEDGSLRWQLLSGGELCFGEGFAEVVGDAHHFARGFHFWPEHRVDARKLVPREYGRLHVEVATRIEIGAAIDELRQEFSQLATGHQSRSNLRHRHASRLGNERHGARGSRIHFEHVDLVAIPVRSTISSRDGELNIHQPNHLQSARQLERVVAHALQQRLRNVDRGQHTRRIAGVHASLFDVLHDSADDNVFAVRKRIYVNFNRILEEVINQHRAVVRVLHRLFHVADDRSLVMRNHHGAAAQHIRRPHQHRISDLPRARDGLFDRGGHDAGRLRNLQLFQQFVEVLAVLGQVD